MQFDYQRAWTEVAKPAFDALSQDMVYLLVRTRDEVGSLSQDRDHLDVIGDSPVLKSLFASAEVGELAAAARAVYFYGHWAWTGTVGKEVQDGGLNWKFSNLADQALSARMGLARRRRDTPRGMSFAVHEGVIRVQFSTRDEWNWVEMGLATPMLYEGLKGSPWHLYEPGGKWVDQQVRMAKNLRKTLSPQTFPMSGFFNLGKYGGNHD